MAPSAWLKTTPLTPAGVPRQWRAGKRRAAPPFRRADHPQLRRDPRPRFSEGDVSDGQGGPNRPEDEVPGRHRLQERGSKSPPTSFRFARSANPRRRGRARFEEVDALVLTKGGPGRPPHHVQEARAALREVTWRRIEGCRRVGRARRGHGHRGRQGAAWIMIIALGDAWVPARVARRHSGAVQKPGRVPSALRSSAR